MALYTELLIVLLALLLNASWGRPQWECPQPQRPLSVSLIPLMFSKANNRGLLPLLFTGSRDSE